MPSLNTQATAIPEPFVPLASLHNALRYWWIIVLLIVAGGLFGWLAFRANPPLYEASAQFSVGIDFIRTGPLTQYEEDVAINTVGEILTSRKKEGDVLPQVVEKAGAENIHTSVIELLKNSTVERKLNVWDLRVRNVDAKTAERIATIWMEQGQSVIQESYQHALQASALERYTQSLESCLAKVAASEPAYGLCDRAHFAEIQKDLQAAGASLYEEKLASRGLFDGLTLGPVDPPVLSQRPVTYGRNQYILFGGLLGMLAGIAVIELGFPARLIKRR